MEEHGLDKLRVETVGDLIFATFSNKVEPLHEYLGTMIVTEIERICHSPIKVLGDERQLVSGNWKLYAENTRDPYHASLLHMFHNTFGLYRSSQKGGSFMEGVKGGLPGAQQAAAQQAVAQQAAAPATTASAPAASSNLAQTQLDAARSH